MSEYSQKNHANAKLFPLTHLCAAFADYLTQLSQHLYVFGFLPDRCMRLLNKSRDLAKPTNHNAVPCCTDAAFAAHPSLPTLA